MTYDPKRRLVMASFKTVLGHNLPAGTPLTVVEEPKARGEIDLAMATRLHGGRIAVYAEDARPTPVETPEQERNRLALEALRDAPADDPDAFVATDDLTVWQADDAETGKKAGDKVTNDDLRAIAEREGALIESDDNKPDLQRKIMERRAAVALGNVTNSDTQIGAGEAVGGSGGSTGAGTGGRADRGAPGDGHGTAGEGESDQVD
jgi:hypothetical protein